RSPVPENRRMFMVKLTPKGRRTFAKMAQRHEEWVNGLLGHLGRDEADQLMHLLERVKPGL
ncbi:MAG TPA: MarR family winged helix-turn-helix transcriptional regulator, partial [Kineobactrum sp.]